MRPDMFKVIVERPRGGGGWATKQRIVWNDDRTKVPMNRNRSKSLNENLAPLRRFLRRSVGRPWNAVFSEICEGLSVRNPVQKHVRDHLKDLVLLHTFERDGKLWFKRWEEE